MSERLVSFPARSYRDLIAWQKAIELVTETYRAGADGRDKLERLLRTLYSLLQDLTFLNSRTPELVRNTDIQGELKSLAESADFEWIAMAAGRLNDVERGMRRNLLRSLSLDAFATALERST